MTRLGPRLWLVRIQRARARGEEVSRRDEDEGGRDPNKKQVRIGG